MKTKTSGLLILLFALGLQHYCFGQFNIGKVKVNKEAISGVDKVIKGITLTEEEVIRYTKESVQWMDEHNPVISDDNSYARRLKGIVKNHVNEDGLTLNFKVYDVEDINAFACADGSVRVFRGLMDLMTDDELLSVIGHEIGHVKSQDTKDAMKRAYSASAARDIASSQGGAVAAISNSQLGDLAEAFVNAKFSRDQESAADNYAFNFLKRNKYSLAAMGLAFRKLQKLEEDAGSAGGNKQLFSSHPDSGERAEKMEKKAKELMP